MKHEELPSENTPPSGVSRRKFIAGTAATIAAAGLAYLEREKLGVGDLPDVQKEYAAKREALHTDYERTGGLPDLDARKELVLLQDLAAYMGRSSKSERMSAKDFRAKYEAFALRVQSDAVRESVEPPANLPKGDALQKLLSLKAAFQKSAGTTYNKAHDSIADPILERRYQCRSGTQSLLLLAQEAAEKEDFLSGGEILVAVYTTGHVQPGLLLKDGTLFTLEMTSTGNGIRNFGRMENIKSPICVARADHGMFQETLDTDAHRDKAVLYETVREVRPPERGTMARIGKFGFGDPRIPEGDIEMPKADMLPAEDVFNESRLFNRMERIQSEEELLQAVKNPQEKEYVREFLIHNRTILNYYSAHADVFNKVADVMEGGGVVSQGEVTTAEQELLRIADALETYVRANNLDERYTQSHTFLRKNGVKLVTKLPSDIGLAIRHNTQVLRSRWEKRKR